MIYFRTARHSSMEEDLRTGIAHADYKVAFEIDHFDETAHTGWSVLVQGDVHPMESDDERAAAAHAGVESWVSRRPEPVHAHHPHQDHRPPRGPAPC